MLIVAGYVMVDPNHRQSYLADCMDVVRQARTTSGCLDFSLTADLLDPGRINICERWEDQTAVEEFRGSGPSDQQAAAIVSASVAEYEIATARSLT